MGIVTNIEWCDSTLNLQMGCDGCELWVPSANVFDCYAGKHVNRYAGRKGYPTSFDKPELFLHRLDEAARWPDLSGKERTEKPWLNGYPRTVFLNDLGDTFTESLPLDWLATLLPRMAAMPVIWMVLTKRANRMLAFSQEHPFPKNFWLLTSVTSAANYNRIELLLACKGGDVRGISYEPALGEIDLEPWLRQSSDRLHWVIAGGMSGSYQKPANIEWYIKTRDQCAGRAAYFLKQLGSMPVNGNGLLYDTYFTPDKLVRGQLDERRIKLKDKKGGDASEWPEGLRVRQMPVVGQTTQMPGEHGTERTVAGLAR